MKLPNLTDLTPAVGDVWPFLVTGGAALALTLAAVAFLTRRAGRHRTDTSSQENDRGKKVANRLTFLVAVAIGALSARGMGHFFYDKLNFPLLIVIVGGGIFEIAAFTCALRARLNIKDPDVGKAGADGVAVWVIAGLSGFFSAMDAGFNEVGLFQLVLPFGAAWLWERGMSIERRKGRKARGVSAIHLRVTPERVLVWLRVAEPSGRTASEVDAQRRVTRVAKAAAKVRSLKANDAREGKLTRAQKKLERTTLSAVAHANLAKDPTRKEELLSQVRFIFNALSLADIAPDSPWSVFTAATEHPASDLAVVTPPPSGHRALEASTDRRVTVQVSDPTAGPVTPKSLAQATPTNSGQVTPQVTKPAASPVAQDTRVKPPAEQSSRQMRTDQELIADLESIVAEHYRQHPGEEIKVKPLAKQLGIGRDRARRLLDEMNVRPLRKAANQ